MNHKRLVVTSGVLAASGLFAIATSFGATSHARSSPLYAVASGTGPIRIVVGVGIGGVGLGASRANVRRVLGKPRSVVAPYWIFGGRLQGRVTVEGDSVSSVLTQSNRERTDRGIGPGSSLQQLKRAYGNLGCRTARGRLAVVCYVLTRRGSKLIETDFLVWRKTILAVEIYARQQPKPTMS